MNLKLDNAILPNFNKYNFLLSDWSGIFIEYIFLKKENRYFLKLKRKN